MQGKTSECQNAAANEMAAANVKWDPREPGWITRLAIILFLLLELALVPSSWGYPNTFKNELRDFHTLS